MKAINLASNNLQSLNPLSQNENLEKICVCYNKSINLQEIFTNHTSLHEICNTSTSGYSIEMIEPLTQLKRVVLSENITNRNIKKLKDHNNLEECSLSNVNEKAIDVSSLRNIKELELNGDFMEVVGLHHLKKLKSLNLSSDNLSSIIIPKNLKELAIMECKFGDLFKIKNIENLNSLCLSVTEVTDLSPLKNATSLKSLDIQFNQIATIEPIIDLIINGLEVEFDKTDVPEEVLYMYEENKLDEIVKYYSNK